MIASRTAGAGVLALTLGAAAATASAQPADESANADASPADGAEAATTAADPEPEPAPSPDSDPTPEPAPAAAPWIGHPEYPEPGLPPPGLKPAPKAGDQRYWRYAVELIPELGAAWPRCQEGEVSSRNCAGVKFGGHAGFTALWRVLPYFAWGGTLGVAAFQYEPPSELARRNASAASVSLFLLARAYFLEEGEIDPYVQLGLGGGALGTAFDETVDDEPARFEETGAGPALQIGAGIDFYLGRRLRLGPAATFTQVFVDKVRRCTGTGEGECVDLRKADDGHLGAYATISARLTLCLGEEL